jgi:hypothetical protein
MATGGVPGEFVAASRQARGTRWRFTQNLQRDGECPDWEAINARRRAAVVALQAAPGVKGGIYQLETGAEGRPHFQGMFAFSR